MFRKNTLIFLPIGAAILLATLACAAAGFETVAFGDTPDYIDAANAFLNGTDYPRQSGHPMFRPPLFPLVIAAVWSVFPASVVAVKVVQILLHAATAWAIYHTSFEIFERRTPAFLGAMLCALHPLLASHTTDFFTEPLQTFLCAAAMLFLVRFLKEGLLLNALSSGALWGLATLNRPAILGVVICLIIYVAAVQIKSSERIKKLTATAMLTAAMFLTILPWTIYNYRTTGEIILVNDGFSYNLWLGNLPETIVLYEGGFQSKEENQRFADRVWGEIQREKLAELERTDNYSQLKLNEREKVWRREAWKNINANPALTARLIFGKTWVFWTPFLNHWTYNWKIVAAVAAFVIFIYVFGIYGAFVAAQNQIGRQFLALLLITFVVTTAIHAIIFGFVRYRVPNVDPSLCLLSGAALWSLSERFFRNR